MKIEDVINRRELAERLDGDMDLFRELADLFIEDSEKLLGSIKEAIDEKDQEKLRKYAHTIKGSVSNFSAPEAYDAAFSLESMGRSGDISGAEDGYKLLLNKIQLVREAMTLLMKESSL